MLPRLYLYLRKKKSNFQSLLNSDEMTLLHSEQLSQPDDLIITVLVYVDWKKKKRFVSVLRITQILSLDPKTKKERKRKETQILENTYPILAMNLTSESQPHVLGCFGLCMLLFSLSWLTDSFIWLTLSAVLAAHCRKYFVLRFFFKIPDNSYKLNVINTKKSALRSWRVTVKDPKHQLVTLSV